MKTTFSFAILIFPNGYQSITTTYISPKEFNVLGMSITAGYRHPNEVKQLIDEIKNGMIDNKPYHTGYNDFSLKIVGTKSFVKWDLNPEDKFTEIPTEIVLRFFQEYLDFLNLYYSGGIPGLIPPKMFEKWKEQHYEK